MPNGDMTSLSTNMLILNIKARIFGLVCPEIILIAKPYC